MASSRHIAGLVGPTLLAITVSEYVNPHIWPLVTPPITYQAGTMLFVASLAIIRTHNIWVRGWPVLLTFLGWIGLGLGLVRMFMPELAQRTVEHSAIPLIAQFVLFVGGLFLTFKGFGYERSGISTDERLGE